MITLSKWYTTVIHCEIAQSSIEWWWKNMVSTIGKWSKSEIRIAISFLHAKGNPSAEIDPERTPFMGMIS